nr:MAG TPA: hypothetical protein [Caudoviricetes sp.]
MSFAYAPTIVRQLYKLGPFGTQKSNAGRRAHRFASFGRKKWGISFRQTGGNRWKK